MYFPVSYPLKALCTLLWHIKFSEGQVLPRKTVRSAFIYLPQPHLQGPEDCFGLLRVSVIPFCWPGTIQATVGRLTNKRQGVEPKVGCTYLMALLGVHSGGRSPGQELRTHLLGGADPCNTASSQESAENVFSL